MRRGADETGMQHYGTLLESERVNEVYIITELLTSSEFDSLPSESRSFDTISKDNIDVIKTVYFEITGKDTVKLAEDVSKSLESNLPKCVDPCVREEELLKKQSMSIVLWMHQDKLIYALVNFLESETMTIDEIKEFLLNNPEVWQ